MDEVQQAAKLVLEFNEESRRFLRGLSEQLGERKSRGILGGKMGKLGIHGFFFFFSCLFSASRAFRKLQESPVRRLLEQKPQKALPAEGE